MLYRPVRRKDREVSDLSWMESVLDRALACHLSLFDGEWPYVIPITFGYEPGHIYFHSAKEGKKIDIIRSNPKASFCVEVDAVPFPNPKGRSGLLLPYKSVVGYGHVSVVPDDEEERKRHGLAVLAAHYCRQGVDIPRPRALLDKVAVLDLEIVHMTGKQKGPFIER
ncbi:MAG: pyridoxamine 5'-phosphate oxidase family protein [Dethiosulfovibrio sp.]|nr:pyridoxamine 5'-phosphate oxidase family protein [Dethiosulfovibrio sp.]